jgi:hypothetical protein
MIKAVKRPCKGLVKAYNEGLTEKVGARACARVLGSVGARGVRTELPEPAREDENVARVHVGVRQGHGVYRFKRSAQRIADGEHLGPGGLPVSIFKEGRQGHLACLGKEAEADCIGWREALLIRIAAFDVFDFVPLPKLHEF